MESWLDLESRFRALAPALQSARLDAQWGAAGEYWRIAGVRGSSVTQQFEILATQAGTLLSKALVAAGELDSPHLQVVDAKHRWYGLLKERSPAFGDLSYGTQLNEDGSPAGTIYLGSLHPFAEASANLCLSLQGSHSVTERSSKWRQLYDSYGRPLCLGVILAIVGAGAKVLFG